MQTDNKIQHLNITIVSPGRIYTPISLNALKGDRTTYGKMDKEQVRELQLQFVHEKYCRQFLKRKNISLLYGMKFLWWLWWFARPLYYRIT